MIEFVGLVPFFRRITLRVAMETMRFEPSPNRFILGNFISHLWCHNKQYGTHLKLSWVQCNLTLIPGCKVYITF